MHFTQPLTSILSGIECIDGIVDLISSAAVVPEPTSTAEDKGSRQEQRRMQEVMAEHVKSIRACTRSMKGANSFMTMSINRCIDYTKASKGLKLVPKLETVQLLEALEFPVSIMRDIQSQLPIVLQPIPSRISAHVITDKQWLMENVLCLLSNAARYSHTGHIDLKLSLDRSASAAEISRSKKDVGKYQVVMLRVEVLDTGIGLSDAAMEGLFLPFKQAQRLAGGTGLGLFSLARRVEALQGKFGVSRRPDGAQGSLFWFSIPYRPDSTAGGKVSPMCNYRIGAQLQPSERVLFCGDKSYSVVNCVAIPSLRVLVVDDAPTVLKMTSMLLSKKGHTVEQAVNGAAAVEKLLQRVPEHRCPTLNSSDLADELICMEEGGQGQQAAGFDVVLMDLQMPVMDGVEAIRRIRAVEQRASQELKSTLYNKANARQFIVALSANSDSNTTREALEAGADEFVSKPFSYDTFLEVMRRQWSDGVV